jgi:hypothetical protein
MLVGNFPAGANPAPAIATALWDRWPPSRRELGDGSSAPAGEEGENVKPIKGRV